MYDGSLSTDLIPLKMCSAVVILDQSLPGWELANIEADPTPESRSFAYDVYFDSLFSNIPLVQVGLAGFDIDNRDSNRLSVHTEDISNAGFKIVVETWMHTRVYKVEVSWLALGNM